MWGPSVLARLPWLAWVFIVHCLTTASVNWLLPEPYMDEVFHIPQAQEYCKGHFGTWDPKLTTPPGLYAYSNVVLRPLSLLPRGDEFEFSEAPWWCSVRALRWTNTALSTTVYLVLVSLFRTLHPGRTDAQAALSAFSLAWFPVLFGTSYLYYTDIASTVTVLLAYLLGLRKRHWLSALVCLVSISFRQTNIIWTTFTAAVCLSRALSEDAKTRGRYINPLPIELGGVRKSTGQATMVTAAFSSAANFQYQLTLENSLSAVKSFLHLASSQLSISVPTLLPFFLVEIIFLGCVIWNNGSIVLGDEENHKIAFHVPQLFYLAGFAAVFSSPALLSLDHIPLFVKYVTSRFQSFYRFIFFFAIVAGMAFSVHYFTIHHPFILSDNRHYSFYVWKDIYQKHVLVPYALVPMYFFAGWLCWTGLAIQQTIIWCISYAAAVTLTLVPTPLLEFRYFILPYIVYRLHIRQPTRVRLLAEVSVYTTVNCISLFVFLARPFEWTSEPGKHQRFMW